MEALLGDFSAITDTIEKPHKETVDSQLPRPRHSGRTKRTRGYSPDQEVGDDSNNDKLGVYEVPGMGYGLFATQSFSIKDRVICVYNEKNISQKGIRKDPKIKQHCGSSRSL